MSKDKDKVEAQPVVDPRLKNVLDAVIDDNSELAATNFHGYMQDKMKTILSQGSSEKE